MPPVYWLGMTPPSARRVLLLPGLIAASIAAGCKAQRPNVVLITVDTLRADHCSLYGYRRKTTPNLEHLALRATVYDQAEAPAAYTQGSVGSIMTGLPPSEHGASYHPSILKDSVETLAEALKSRGYDTLAAVGNPILKGGKVGFDQGFRRYQLDNMQRGPDGMSVMRAAAKTTDAAIALLHDRRGEFFLWVHYMDPHWWYTPPPPYDGQFGPPSKEWDEFVEGTFTGVVGVASVYFNNPLPAAARQRGVDLYDGEIAFTDSEINRLLGFIEGLGLMRDTLVIVTSDHGESLGQHGITFCHGFFTYEDNLHVPLIVSPPSRAKVKEHHVAEPTSLLCIKDLILHEVDEAYPLPRPAPLLSESEPLYGKERGNLPGRPRAYVEGEPGKWRSYREGNLKVIAIPRPDRLEIELYDLARDPDEQHDLAASRPADADRMRRRLLSMVPALSRAPGEGQAPAQTSTAETPP